MDIIILLGYIPGLIMNGMIAAAKNRDRVGVFLAGLFLTPLTAYLYLLAVPPLPDKQKHIAKDEDDD